MKTKKLICTVLAGVMLAGMAFGFAGCEVLSEFMDDRTIIVVTDYKYSNKEFGVKDFSVANATEVFFVNQTSVKYFNSNRPFNYDKKIEQVYAIKVNENQDLDAAVADLKKLEFVNYAWVNRFDYKSSPSPVDNKIPWDYTESFFETFVVEVSIDLSYCHRLFTVEDFKTANAVAVCPVGNRFVYYETELPTECFRHSYYVIIKNPSEQNVIAAVEKLEKLNFIRSACGVPEASLDV